VPQSFPIRIATRSRSALSGFVSRRPPGTPPRTGLWWPYSRDLTREGPHLVDDFPTVHGKIDRMVYFPDDWEVVADEVLTNRGRIKVGFLPPEHPGGVVLLRLVGSGIVQVRVAWIAPRLAMS
jgi:hypothetical protein